MPGAAVVSGLVVHQPDQVSAGDGRVWSAQTVVLVVLDALGVKGKHPLTYKAASLTLVIEAVTVVAILGVVIAYSQMPPGLVIAHLTPDVVLITAIWVVGCCWSNARKNTFHGRKRARPRKANPNPRATVRRNPSTTRARQKAQAPPSQFSPPPPWRHSLPV